ncbi:MAG TPA: pyridine nucleotide-disulfide oxidoreductase [Desulfobacteraceae bacterium]|nr:pyridine nucleotide-disulfide oxidoreductase [Desulfobacteraceae bacterium]
MSKSVKNKLIIVAGIIVLIAVFFLFDLDRFLSLSTLKSELDNLRAFYRNNQFFSITVYMVGYILMVSLSLPGATVATLAGGAVFGLWTGLIVVSFASTIGATLAFLVSRYMFRDWVQTRFSSKIKTINKGIQKEGGFYLFTLRLVPAFPFFMINLVMGLTPISTRLFYLVSQVGMLPGTFVYVNAGTSLAKIESLAGILSPGLIFSFALLGIFPLVAKKAVEIARAKKVYAEWKRPETFDYNLVVIGAGSGGLVSAYIAAAVKAKVALIEEKKMGGDCLNTGCVPSKSLVASARLLAQAARATDFGFKSAKIEFDFSDIMERVQHKIRAIEPHDSVERYTKLGVECIRGKGEILSPFEVRVGDRVMTTRNIVVATGARPVVPDIPGLEDVDYLTSDTVWDIREQPERLVILGGGPIGCELAQAFQRLGTQVFLVQRGARIMKKEDEDAVQPVMDRFKAEGMTLCLNHSAREVVTRDGGHVLVCDNDGSTVEIPFDRIILALGRKANTTGFGLERLGITLDRKGRIQANPFLQTNYPNIFCCGDVHGRYQFTHTASHESWYAAVNALFGRFKKFKVNYKAIPWATYTDPEVARVGLCEQEAIAEGIPYEKTVYGIDDLDRAIADSTDEGFVKVLTVPGKDAILGVTIVGHHASEMIAEFVLAKTHGLGLNKILGTIHIYPTMAEANKYAAGQWKKAHAPETLLAWVEKFHTWMRSR